MKTKARKKSSRNTKTAVGAMNSADDMVTTGLYGRLAATLLLQTEAME